MGGLKKAPEGKKRPLKNKKTLPMEHFALIVA
jgi:hypothetical protein